MSTKVSRDQTDLDQFTPANLFMQVMEWLGFVWREVGPEATPKTILMSPKTRSFFLESQDRCLLNPFRIETDFGLITLLADGLLPFGVFRLIPDRFLVNDDDERPAPSADVPEKIDADSLLVGGMIDALAHPDDRIERWLRARTR